MHQSTRRMAAIDARLGMDVEDIAANLGVGVDVVERSIEEYSAVSDEDLGVTGGPAGRDEPDTDQPSGALSGTYWVVMGAKGKPVALCESKQQARAVASAVNRALWGMGHDDPCSVESVEAWGAT